MHRLPRNMLQRSPISFISSNIRILNIGVTPPYLVLKSLTKTTIFFRLSTFQFFLLSFYWNYEALTAKPYAEWFSQAFKITFKKIKGINRICLKWSLWKSSTFLIFVLQICLGGCSWYSVNTDFQEICYSTTQSLSDVLKSEFWILGALHHVCSRKVLMKTIIYSTSSLLNFLVGFSSLSAKNRY